ncbi:MAG: hypothetical protein AB8F78_16615 [Saprospiraceae bacterium]
MKFPTSFLLILGLLFTVSTLVSCDKDDDVVVMPVTLGSSVTATNTFQSDAFTSGAEVAIEDLFMAPAGSLAATANVGSAVEFSSYLLNLYDIDINETSISFTVVAASDDPSYGTLFRVLEAGTMDRYYLTFDAAQNVSGSTSDNSAVSLRSDSDKVLVVEIGEGFDFKRGASFSITLN